MSIAPVESLSQAANEQSVNTNGDSGRMPAAKVSEPVSEPVLGTLSEQENSSLKNHPIPYELPEDVVEVHQDPDIKNQIIIQYLDQAKNVILQVPSSQELDVEHGIAQEFQQATELRDREGAARVEGKGEEVNGNKL
jgi:hypothetical protein